MLGSAQVGSRFRSARLGWLGKETTYPLVQSFGSQRAAFDMLTWEDRDQIVHYQISSELLKPFLPALGSGLGSWLGPRLGSLQLRIVVPLDSGLVSRLNTRGLGSTLLEARLGLLKARLS